MIRKYVYMFGIALVCMQAGAMKSQLQVQDVSAMGDGISPSAKALAANFNDKMAAEDNKKEEEAEQQKAKKFMTPRTTIRGTIENTQAALKKLLDQHTASLQRLNIDAATIKARFLAKFDQENSAERKLRDLFFDMYLTHSGGLPDPEISALGGATIGGNNGNKEMWDQYLANGAWNTIMKNVGLSTDGCCVIL